MRRSSLLLALTLLTTGAAFAQAGFEGDWRGSMTPEAGNRSGCAAGGDRSVTVRNGVASMAARDAEAIEDRIGSDGSVSMTGGRNGGTRIAGRFDGLR
ncbi:MAG TPA: hypothetical protein VGM87_13625, partial [Roseomonas sp.]